MQPAATRIELYCDQQWRRVPPQERQTRQHASRRGHVAHTAAHATKPHAGVQIYEKKVVGLEALNTVRAAREDARGTRCASGNLILELCVQTTAMVGEQRYADNSPEPMQNAPRTASRWCCCTRGHRRCRGSGHARQPARSSCRGSGCWRSGRGGGQPCPCLRTNNTDSPSAPASRSTTSMNRSRHCMMRRALWATAP